LTPDAWMGGDEREAFDNFSFEQFGGSRAIDGDVVSNVADVLPCGRLGDNR
jgi:hypothetical protein